MSGSAPSVTTAIAAATNVASVLELFERADCPCFCRYWDFSGDKHGWQNRCANETEVSRRELDEAVGSGTLHAVVALQGQRVVGWMRLERVANMHKVYEGRLYRGLPCFSGDRASVWTLACVLVDPDLRRTGVARALLSECIELARQLGATAIEALPRGQEDVTDEEHWMGPPGLLREAGFETVRDFAPYPVLRLHLTPRSSTTT